MAACSVLLLKFSCGVRITECVLLSDDDFHSFGSVLEPMWNHADACEHGSNVDAHIVVSASPGCPVPNKPFRMRTVYDDIMNSAVGVPLNTKCDEFSWADSESHFRDCMAFVEVFSVGCTKQYQHFLTEALAGFREILVRLLHSRRPELVDRTLVATTRRALPPEAGPTMVEKHS